MGTKAGGIRIAISVLGQLSVGSVIPPDILVFNFLLENKFNFRLENSGLLLLE